MLWISFFSKITINCSRCALLNSFSMLFRQCQPLFPHFNRTTNSNSTSEPNPLRFWQGSLACLDGGMEISLLLCCFLTLLFYLFYFNFFFRLFLLHSVLPSRVLLMQILLSIKELNWNCISLFFCFLACCCTLLLLFCLARAILFFFSFVCCILARVQIQSLRCDLGRFFLRRHRPRFELIRRKFPPVSAENIFNLKVARWFAINSSSLVLPTTTTARSKQACIQILRRRGERERAGT